MKDLEIPPDATVFRAGGVPYFLYMGALEMRDLQREWGLQRAGIDSPEAWEKKQEEFQDRLNGGAMEDKLTVLRYALKRWAVASSNGNGPVELTDESVAEIVERIDQSPAKGKRRKAPFVMVAELLQRFYVDCFGLAPSEEAATDPKAKSQEGSTPSGS